MRRAILILWILICASPAAFAAAGALPRMREIAALGLLGVVMVVGALRIRRRRQV